MRREYRPDQVKTAEWIRDEAIQFYGRVGLAPKWIEISPETWAFLGKPGAIAGIRVVPDRRLWPWEVGFVA